MGKRKAKRLRLQQKRASALRAEQNRRTDEIPEVLAEAAFSDSGEASVKNEEHRKTTAWAWEAPRDERPMAQGIPSFLQQEEPADGEEVASVRAQAPEPEPEPVLRMPPSRPRLDAWPKRRGHIHVVVTAGLLPDEVKTLKQILQVNWEADEAQASETASVRRDLMASFHRTPDYWVLPPGHTLQDRREEGVQCWIACEDPEELFEAHLGRFAEHPDVDKIRFLLFYQNAAHYIGAKLTEDTAPEQAAQQWLERCQTLLDFQARYPEETLLLDSTQALQNPFDLRDAAYRLNLPIDTQRGRSKTERQPEQALAVALAADWIQQHPAIAQMTGLLSAQAESVRGQLQLVPSNQAIQAYRGLKSQIRQALQEKTKLQSDLDAQSKKIWKKRAASINRFKQSRPKRRN